MCNARYQIKGKRGCESRHIDERVLYKAFVNVFNAVVENKDYFMDKWRNLLSSYDILKATKRFLQIFLNAKPIDQFDVDVYFKMVEKITVYDAGRLVVSMLDGSEVERKIG